MPSAVGELVRVRMHRVVRAHHRRADRLGLGDQPRAERVVDREALGLRVLVHADAREVDARAVEDQVPVAGDADRADAARSLVRADSPHRRRRLQVDVVEVGLRGRPQRGRADPKRALKDVTPLPGMPRCRGRCGASRRARDADALGARADVAEADADPHGRGAARAAEQRRHAHGLPVDHVAALEVDLALESRVVPPAAGRRPVCGQARGREVGRAAPGVDADDEPVGAAALEAAEAELERDVRTPVGTDRAGR